MGCSKSGGVVCIVGCIVGCSKSGGVGGVGGGCGVGAINCRDPPCEGGAMSDIDNMTDSTERDQALWESTQDFWGKDK